MNKLEIADLFVEAANNPKQLSDIVDKLYYPLEKAKKQRFESLKNAFATIDQFVTPSVYPEMGEEYDKLKAHLLEVYSKGIE